MDAASIANVRQDLIPTSPSAAWPSYAGERDWVSPVPLSALVLICSGLEVLDSLAVVARERSIHG